MPISAASRPYSDKRACAPMACASHKEYAQPLGRKTDPAPDMVAFRSAVAAILSGPASPPVLIPAAEPPRHAPAAHRAAKRSGAATRAMSSELCSAKSAPTRTADFGNRTEAARRLFQRAQRLVQHGIAGPKTWAALELVA
jgi:hypothetical protein